MNTKKNIHKKIERNYNKTPIFSLIIFILIIIYIFAELLFNKSEKPVYFLLEKSFNTNDMIFETTILFDDIEVKSNYSGYPNYLVNNGEKIKKDFPFLLLSNDSYDNRIINNNFNNSLDLTNLIPKLNTFLTSIDYNNLDLNKFEYIIDEYLISNKIKNIKLNYNSNDLLVKTPTEGIISYYSDNYVGKQINDFEDIKYTSKSFYNKSYINKGEYVARVIKGKTYNLISKIDKNLYDTLSPNKDIVVDFINYNLSAKGILTLQKKDKNYYLNITLNELLPYFINERFVTIRVNDNISNLTFKIPKSAIVKNNLYKIPKNLFIYNDNKLTLNILKNDNNKEKIKTYKNIEIKYEDKNNYYCLIPNELIDNTYNFKTISGENKEYTLNKKKIFDGVYVTNSYYKDFKIIEYIDTNKDYVLAKPDIPYSISNYDYILLNANKLKIGEN